jgi:hypothetical protein
MRFHSVWSRELAENLRGVLQTPVPTRAQPLRMAFEIERRFRENDAGVFFVLPRVVRRVVQNQLEFANPWLPPPHRKSCVVERDRLQWLVARDELGIDASVALPRRVILLARPDDQRLAGFSREDLLRYYWRLLFHARIDFELETTASTERLPVGELRKRIAHLGQTQFDEIRSVLRSEQMLRRPDDPRQVYAEFVAVYHELRAFAPELLAVYFPSLDDESSVLAVIGGDCDAAALLAATRPDELASAHAGINKPSPGADGEPLFAVAQVRLTSRSPRRYAALARRADRLREQGNNVRAALVRRRAFDKAPLDQMVTAQRELVREVEFLVLRLQAALELTDEAIRPWLAMCERLLPAARHGFWNINARLLYDLQQVCLVHEQEMYRVDLLGWARSRGGKPLKRPLPNHRVVLMSKHLRRAAQRIPAVTIDEVGRRELSDLLHAAADAAEQLLRRRFEALVNETLTAARFIAGSVVERVGFFKLTQELLDGIVDRGFLTLGDLRDAISRNDLKSTDLASAREFFAGDPLLSADRLLAGNLDGVYQRGPFYLRWLQRGTSLAFGIPFGRAMTKYLALPFGLSFLVLMAIEEIAHLLFRNRATIPVEESAVAVEAANEAVPAAHQAAAAAHHYLVYSHWHMFWLGCVIFALLHVQPFRAGVLLILKSAWKLVRGILFDIPRKLAALPPVAWLLQSFPMLLLRRFVMIPALVTGIIWGLLPALGMYPPLDRWRGWGLFFALLVALNSRIGRDTQELTREFLIRTLDQIRVHFVVGLFTLIVDGLRWLMDGLERVLYAVDEWLRFRSGESNLVLAIKAVVGLAWSFVHGVIRFCVTLLIEPQINPIKHFPVVTVSHKLVLGTLAIPLTRLLESFYDKPTAFTIASLILAGIPGVFGFLAWELKENWMLYAANRSSILKPVRIGHHGETLRRLLVPGFHSGTIPKLFAKRRRAAGHAAIKPHVDRQVRFVEKLNHAAEALRHFVERELIGLLQESRTYHGRDISVGRVELSTNRVLVTLCDAGYDSDPVVIEFCEQSGWIIASVASEGWLAEMIEEDRKVFRAALSGLYKRAAAGLVREQIESNLVAAALPDSENAFRDAGHESRHAASPATHPYDISSEGLVVWPYRQFDSTVRYSLEDRPMTSPRPRSLARAAGLAPLPLSAIVYQEHLLQWEEWRAYWDTEQNVSAIPIRLLPDVELLGTQSRMQQDAAST